MLRQRRDRKGSRIIWPKSMTKIVDGSSLSRAERSSAFSESLPVRVTERPSDVALSSTGEGFSLPFRPERVGSPVMIRVKVRPLLINSSRHRAAKFPVPMNQMFNLEMTSSVLCSFLFDCVSLEA